MTVNIRLNISQIKLIEKETKMSTEKEIEKEISDKGLNAPRLTPELIDSVIVSKDFYIFPNTQLTVCCLTLKNGFTVTGESACASPENFDREIGENIAFKNAREKVWVLEGYLLKQHLFSKNSKQEGTY